MSGKYAPLTRYLCGQPPGDEVILDLETINQMVGGLPPSAVDPTWWANTAGHSQALAWLANGRRVSLAPDRVIFSPVADNGSVPTLRVAPRTSTSVMDGIDALDAVLRRAGYESVAAAVSEHTVFLHPDTVGQTNGKPVFPVIRDMFKRGTFDTLQDGRRVLLDDNTSPTLTFLWAANRGKGRDVQYNHIWTDSRNPDLYTALWNICAGPAFLAKTTDGHNHPEVRAALQYRAYELYGMHPPAHEPPARPDAFDRLSWAPMPDAVTDLPAVLRGRLASSPKSRPASAARTIGWLYSGWQPDETVGVDPGAELNPIAPD